MPKQIPAAVAEAIISAVKKRESLYNMKMPEYRNRNIAELAWKSVADEVQQEVSYCKFLWASLRGTFNRNLANLSRRKPKWQFYQQMLFLREHVVHGQVWRDLPQPKEEEDSQAEEENDFMINQQVPSDEDNTSTTHEDDIQASAPTTPAGGTPTSEPGSDASKKCKAEEDVDQEIIQFIKKKKRKAAGACASEADDVQGLDVFGHLLPIYRQLPPLKQLQFMHHISGYLMELYNEAHTGS